MSAPTGTQPLPPAVQEKNLRYDLMSAATSAPWALLSLPASFIIAALLTQYYGIQQGMYGLIASMPAWCNALQIILVPLMARYMGPRDMMLSMAWLNMGLWVLLSAILSYLPSDNARDAGHIFLIFFLLTSLSSSFVGVGWTAWIQQWVPENIRGNHFGKRNRLIGFTTVAFLVISMVVLDKLDGSLWAYQILIIICAAGRFISVLWTHPIVSPVADTAGFGGSGWLRQLSDLRHHPGFLRMVVINTWIGFWMGLVGPFVPVYAYEHLAIAPWQMAFLSILTSVTAALALPVWGRVLDKNGCVPVMVAGLFFWRLADFAWCFISPQTNWVLYLLYINGGIFSGAFMLGQFNLILRLMPAHARTAAVSLNLAVMSLAAGIAPILGGYLLQDYAGDSDLPYRLGIGAMCLASILCVPFLRRIKEPEKVDPKGVLGAMRTAREIIQVQSLNMLAAANTIARKRLPRAPKATQSRSPHSGSEPQRPSDPQSGHNPEEQTPEPPQDDSRNRG